MHSFSNLRKSALKAYVDSKQRRRRATIGRILIAAIVLILIISGSVYTVAGFTSGRIGLPSFLHSENLERIAAGLIGLRSDIPSQESDAGNRGPSGSAQQLPSPLPSHTPTLAPTATPFLPDTRTPTPTVTSTASVTPTASSTPRPSPTLTASSTSDGSQTPTPTITASPAPTEISFPGCDPSGNPAFESSLLSLINSARESEGMSFLSSQSRLKSAALAHSSDMACNGFFSHKGSDGSDVEQRVIAHGYSATLVAENIYATGDTSTNAPQLALSFWMASPPNKANILHGEFTEIGISYIFEPSSPFGGYFTVVFALP